MAKSKPTDTSAPASVAEAPVAEAEIEQPLPAGWGSEEVAPEGLEAPADETVVDEAAAPTPGAPREYVVLNGPASFGPVVMNGQSIRARAGVVYHLPNAEERADVLATGFFRGATATDITKAGLGSTQARGSITRESLPPGALKGGLIKP
ncbi:MAG: hypothetical protein ACYC6T_08030 [Thermoleophilia bacterium]